MDKQHKVAAEITGYKTNRQVEHIGDDLVTGECTYELVLSFPNGKKHLAKVSHEAFDSYLEAIGIKAPEATPNFHP